jgi:membrane-associated PAP2 superfamily phosphatase
MLAVFESTALDRTVQDAIFAAGGGAWPLADDARSWRLLFYDGPKAALVAFGAVLTVCTVVSFVRRRQAGARWRALAHVALVLASVPALAGLGKAVTNVHCPRELARYGGSLPYVRLFDARVPGVSAKAGRCFPAGHASGGYGLLGIAYVVSARYRLAAALSAIALGTLMGGYQMLVGAHFLSHTLATLLLAWIVAEGWSAAILRRGSRWLSR